MPFSGPTAGKRSAVGKLGVAALTFATAGLLGSSILALPAAADTAPADGVTATVGGRSLPTWQVNGVVWSQTMAGNNVYVGGSFSHARPPGVAAGGAGERPSKNLFAFDVTTGNPIANFNHETNGEVIATAISPDKTTVYVGGTFTAVDGQARGHVAAFDVATGALLPPVGSVDGTVRALAVSDTTVYVGGTFSSAGGASRGNLAAFTRDGALASWAPNADNNVRAMVIAGGRVIVGGSFYRINSTVVRGSAALDPVSGAVGTWQINSKVYDYGNNAGITSLRTDGTNVYGTAFNYDARPSGSLEGSFAARATDGALVWVNDCLGDSYDTVTTGGVVYVAGHPHDCSAVGQFPDAERWQRALALTVTPQGTNTGPDKYGWNYNGVPKPGMLHWYPQLIQGTITGQAQAAWSAQGNDEYVVMGGEFPIVDGLPQQGLARFSRTAMTSKPRPWTNPTRTLWSPTATAMGNGAIRINYQSSWDPDSENLSYEIYRNFGKADQKLVATKELKTNFWTLPDQTYTDRPETAGTYSYTIKIKDATGNSYPYDPTPAVAGGLSLNRYASGVTTDGASGYWRLGETSGAAVYDWVGSADGTLSGNYSRNAVGAIANDADKATQISAGTVALGANATPAPAQFTEELWFKTTAKNGKLFGYNTAKTGTGTSDRIIAIDGNGRLRSVIGGRQLTSPSAYNNGAWHHVVVSYGTGGTVMYVDGQKVNADAAGAPSTINGYWRVNGENTPGWFSSPDPNRNYLNATIDDVAVYPTALSSAQVLKHYQLGSGAITNQPPAAAITQAEITGVIGTFAGTATDADGTVAAISWDFGDGTSATGTTANHTYAAPGTYTVKFTVTDKEGAKTTVSTDVTIAPQVNPQTVADLFNRSVTPGWGTPDVGPAWTPTANSYFAVAAGNGTATLKPGQGPFIASSATSASTDLFVSYTTNNLPSAGAQYLWTIARGDGNNGYGAKLRVGTDGAVSVQTVKLVAGAETALGTANVGSFTPGQYLNVRTQAVGSNPTTVQVKVWAAGTTEPDAWQVSSTDATGSLQGEGGIALKQYLSGIATQNAVYSFDTVEATKL